MTVRRQSLLLPLPPDEVAGVVTRVVGELGWELASGGPGRFEVREDANKLHCHCSPLRARLEVGSSDGDASRLQITGEVPGWGPVASKHASEQTDLLARRLGLAAAAASRPS